MKVLNLKLTVYENVKNNPEAAEILKDLGFVDIVKPGMLNTAGRFMTIPKGAAMKKISLDTIKKTFIEKGYEVIE
ncbi:DUF1858 domain-containing protein [Fonticella tunisiensis]|uniref:Uncharacterized protein DUF1858 n=1 Tax=Fonticella tunisiensis TaxID=1096341 RepID=A0A4R7KWS9_9CLOT|nr:DUF1858 domain-containing protein [Fonticella tunisiensis]TDT63356.1 uncharacterized protein DUF1858 [Fonticella tunisiensis]